MSKFIVIAFLLIPFFSYSNDQIEYGIDLINEHHFEKSEKILSNNSLLKSSRAQFWLAVAQYENGDHFKAGETFKKAAELGNPWAMARLVPDWGNPCGLLGWPCSSSWKSKAIQRWKELSEQGDGKAMYALAIREKKWWSYIPYYRNKKFFEIAKKGLKNGGVAFLTDTSFWQGHRKEFIEYLRKFAKLDYAPAMAQIANYQSVSVEERIGWLEQGVNLGFPYAARVLALFYWGGGAGFPKSGIKSYYYGAITKHLSLNSYDNDIEVLEELPSGEKKIVRIVTEEEQKKLDKKAQEFLSNVKPNSFWNENTVDLY